MFIISQCLCSRRSSKKKTNSDIIEIITCFLGKQELITDIKDIIEVIKSGKYTKLITIAFKVYSDVTNAIKEYIPKGLAFEPEPFNPSELYKLCVEGCKRNMFTFNICVVDCAKFY